MTNGEKYKTTKERTEAFHEYVLRNTGVNADNYLESAFNWLDLEAPAEEPLPCPFCGKDVEAHNAVNDLSRMVVECTCCEYTTASFDSEYAAIAAHNLVARAVAKEKEANDANA